MIVLPFIVAGAIALWFIVGIVADHARPRHRATHRATPKGHDQ